MKKIFYLTISVLFFSCETNDTPFNDHAKSNNRNTLRININENILSLNPASIGSDSEKFLKYQLYEGLYNVNKFGKTAPALIKEHKTDSLTKIHTLILKPKVAFHNGELLNMADIYSMIKRIIDDQSNEPILEYFKKNIKGYEQYVLRKKYKIGKDSVPSGIIFIDHQTFSINSSLEKNELAFILADPKYWIYKTNNEIEFLGTGPYKIEYANEDISYNLKYHDLYHSSSGKNIKTINIRFIKNKSTEISEFLNGSLDLIIEKANTQNAINITNYQKFNTTESSLASITYLNLNNIYDLNLKIFLTKLIRKTSNKTVLENILVESKDNNLLDSLFIQLAVKDSANKIDLPFYIKPNTKHTKAVDQLKRRLSKYINLNEVNIDQLNQNISYLVIEESKKHIYDNSIINTQEINTENKIILSVKRDKIFSNTLLKGLIANTNWELGVQDLYYIKPRTLN